MALSTGLTSPAGLWGNSMFGAPGGQAAQDMTVAWSKERPRQAGVPNQYLNTRCPREGPPDAQEWHKQQRTENNWLQSQHNERTDNRRYTASTMASTPMHDSSGVHCEWRLGLAICPKPGDVVR